VNKFKGRLKFEVMRSSFGTFELKLIFICGKYELANWKVKVLSN
jgi:hypothetical protein